jgi:tRNA1(Val) A37 N6-methylase TrmN6
LSETDTGEAIPVPADPEVTHDSLLDGRVTLAQPRDGFRVAIDTVLLAAAVPAAAGDRVMEFGAGCGAASLCLARRVNGVHVTGIELQPPLVRLAGENIRANGLEGVVDIMRGDITAPLPPRVQGPFDTVMFNPPFLEDARSRPSASASRTTANIEGEADLARWIACAWPLLRNKGTLVMVHRADRLDDIFAALRGRFGDISVFPLWPRAGAPGKRVIVSARKGVASPVTILPGLVLHEADGRYTAAADAILRGAALTLRGAP